MLDESAAEAFAKRALGDAINAMRAADNENGGLLALRSGAAALEKFGDTDAIDHLSNMAIDVHNLDPDTVQLCIGQGIEISRRRRATNGHGEEPADTSAAPTAEVLPFETFDARNWQGVPIEPRQFTVRDWIPAGEAGIVAGDGGIGKTRLMLQLAVGIAGEWSDWVGQIIETHGPALAFSAEEKLNQMHRVVAGILASRGLSFSDLKHGLYFICDQDDVALGKADRDGTVKPTRSLLRLEKTVSIIRPSFVLIENAAEVFVGDERVRGPVAAFVRKLLGGLTQPSNAAVALIQHPSLSGLQDGTGRAGSTGWRNAGRWQHNFTAVKSNAEDFDLRQLHLAKINYGRPGEKLFLRWDRGVFVPASFASPPFQGAPAEAQIDDAFLRCLDAATAQGRTVSDKTGRNYAPAIFARMPEAKGIKGRAFDMSMARLFSANRIKVQTAGTKSNPKAQLVRVE